MNHDSNESNHNDLVSKSVRLADAADPREGVRLIKAFLEIKEQGRREKLICMAEDLTKTSH
jgi:hypothetical protein